MITVEQIAAIQTKVANLAHTVELDVYDLTVLVNALTPTRPPRNASS